MVINEERNQMTSYWKEHSQHQTLESMMLDSNAKTLNELEAPEILNKIPSFAGMDVLELAAGIGRYTVHLAKQAKSVTAVEFMEEFHQQNLERHRGQDHMEFLCEDVTMLKRDEESYDMVFSNWILMYLGDDEVKKLAVNLLKWLRPGGTLFFRESCFRQSGNAKRTSNPTHYRHPAFYVDAFRSIFMQEPIPNDPDGRFLMTYFQLVSTSSVNVYRKLKKNYGQVCFRWEKVTKACKPTDVASFREFHTFQQFLDTNQYSLQSIKRYERIFGHGFVSTGGLQTTTEFLDQLQLKPGQHVLDVGCGLGGGAFLMGKKYGVSVVGIDLSTNMINVALERIMKEVDLDVEFEVCDATTKEYPPNSFDVIYSRDTLLHIRDKVAMFQKMFKWLKPGGKLMITDYCCGAQELSTEFKAYVDTRWYYLATPAEYGDAIAKSGFENVQVQDRTSQFIDILTRELSHVQNMKEDFIQDTGSVNDYDIVVQGWKNKISFCESGDQKWGFFTATKSI